MAAKNEWKERAPAKVNLWLRVLGKREDGFHEIETRMLEIGVADELCVTRLSEGTDPVLSCEGADLPVDESNLVVKALRVLERECARSFPVEMVLKKNIPHGAGLGGGSSDAAALFRAVNGLFELGYSMDALRRMAATIGSDVAFFLEGGACDCRGRGEQVESVAWETPLRLLLAKPDFPVPTPWAYQSWKTSQEMPEFSYTPQTFSWGSLVNDLERPVFEKHLVLGVMKTWFLQRAGVAGALMSGSGSTVLAVLEEETDAEALGEKMKEEFGSTLWVCETVTAGG
ncbi:MAG: 4-(cytidine 5'-diphospho)-2-C-methyl-D-erythritol kinase [Verrucomicrobiota bacterium]